MTPTPLYPYFARAASWQRGSNRPSLHVACIKTEETDGATVDHVLIIRLEKLARQSQNQQSRTYMMTGSIMKITTRAEIVQHEIHPIFVSNPSIDPDQPETVLWGTTVEIKETDVVDFSMESGFYSDSWEGFPGMCFSISSCEIEELEPNKNQLSLGTTLYKLSEIPNSAMMINSSHATITFTNSRRNYVITGGLTPDSHLQFYNRLCLLSPHNGGEFDMPTQFMPMRLKDAVVTNVFHNPMVGVDWCVLRKDTENGLVFLFREVLVNDEDESFFNNIAITFIDPVRTYTDVFVLSSVRTDYVLVQFVFLYRDNDPRTGIPRYRLLLLYNYRIAHSMFGEVKTTPPLILPFVPGEIDQQTPDTNIFIKFNGSRVSPTSTFGGSVYGEITYPGTTFHPNKYQLTALEWYSEKARDAAREMFPHYFHVAKTVHVDWKKCGLAFIAFVGDHLDRPSVHEIQVLMNGKIRFAIRPFDIQPIVGQNATRDQQIEFYNKTNFTSSDNVMILHGANEKLINNHMNSIVYFLKHPITAQYLGASAFKEK